MNVRIVDLYQHFAYEKGNGAEGVLQIFIPQDIVEPGMYRRRPAVLIMPGGGYEHVSVREGEPVALRFMTQGYTACVLKYSVKPHPFPVALREAAMAMRYIRENAEELGVEPTMVAATGFSAGGHLCGCLGTLYDAPEVADIGSAEMLRPDALGLCYPVLVSWGRTHGGSFLNLCRGSTELTDRLSLEKRVRPDMPPVFIWHTREDTSVPCRNSLVFADALEKADIPFALHIYNRGRHGLSTADENVYPAGQVPPMSRDVPGWIEAEMEFFREMGLRIIDRGGQGNE